ncbi:hypothetical protein BDF19DRAFT_434950, partial [Syncephalis fuscata]
MRFILLIKSRLLFLQGLRLILTMHVCFKKCGPDLFCYMYARKYNETICDVLALFSLQVRELCNEYLTSDTIVLFEAMS